MWSSRAQKKRGGQKKEKRKRKGKQAKIVKSKKLFIALVFVCRDYGFFCRETNALIAKGEILDKTLDSNQ